MRLQYYIYAFPISIEGELRPIVKAIPFFDKFVFKTKEEVEEDFYNLSKD